MVSLKFQLNRKTGGLLFLAFLMMLLTGCRVGAETNSGPLMENAEAADDGVVVGVAPGSDQDLNEADRKTIQILFTANIEGQVQRNTSLAGVSSLRREFEAEYPYVALVDCGNHTPGPSQEAVEAAAAEGREAAEISNAAGGKVIAVSAGDMVSLMNACGYEYAIPAANELSYSGNELQEFFLTAEYRYLACNLKYRGIGTGPLFGLASGEIVDFGGTPVAFVGVSCLDRSIAQESLREQPSESESGAMDTDPLKENVKVPGRPARLDILSQNDDPEELYRLVQAEVNECHRLGAEYVIVLSSFEGGGMQDNNVSAAELIRHTEGIDAVLDGSPLSAKGQEIITDSGGKEVLLAGCGTALENVGVLTISPKGGISVRFIYTYRKKDAKLQDQIQTIQADEKGN